jgi:hypothetical protein
MKNILVLSLILLIGLSSLNANAGWFQEPERLWKETVSGGTNHVTGGVKDLFTINTTPRMADQAEIEATRMSLAPFPSRRCELSADEMTRFQILRNALSERLPAKNKQNMDKKLESLQGCQRSQYQYLTKLANSLASQANK